MKLIFRDNFFKSGTTEIIDEYSKPAGELDLKSTLGSSLDVYNKEGRLVCGGRFRSFSNKWEVVSEGRTLGVLRYRFSWFEKKYEYDAASRGIFRIVSPAFSKEYVIYNLIQKEPSYYLLGAFKEHVLSGSVMGIVCYDLVNDCLPFMVVENVVVFDNFRGQGIGRALMQEVERIAKIRECAYIMFVSGARRKEAHQFYQAMGYSMDRVQGFKKELTE